MDVADFEKSNDWTVEEDEQEPYQKAKEEIDPDGRIGIVFDVLIVFAAEGIGDGHLGPDSGHRGGGIGKPQKKSGGPNGGYSAAADSADANHIYKIVEHINKGSP